MMGLFLNGLVGNIDQLLERSRFSSKPDSLSDVLEAYPPHRCENQRPNAHQKQA